MVRVLLASVADDEKIRRAHFKPGLGLRNRDWNESSQREQR
jgi:hypothetical protein